MRALIRVFTDLPIARKLFLASAVPVLTLVLLSAFTYWTVQAFSEDENALNEVYVTQRLAEEYLRLVVDLETGFRGFLLTGEDKYLQPYRMAQNHITQVGLSLEAQVAGLEEQRAQIAKVRVLVDDLMADKEAMIVAFKEGRPELARRHIEEGRGRSKMLAIRNEMGTFDRLGFELLNTRITRLAQDRDTMLRVIMGGGIAALLLMVATLHLIARSITTPLAALAKAVATAPTGAEPAMPTTERRDEIGHLARALQTMGVQIRDYVLTVERAVADQRRLNEDLSASESKYRNVVDLAPFGIFTTNGFSVTFSNRYNQQLAGLNPEGDDPEAFRRAIHPDDRERVLSEFAAAVESGRAYETVFRFRQQDGSLRKVLSRRIPLEREPGQPVQYLGFNIDITALDHMQVRLSRAERLATLGQVAAGIAHEIRNPLVGIGATTRLLMDDFDANDPRRADLDIILKETKRLDRIVNQIVEYARPRELVVLPFDLGDLVDESLKLLDAAATAKQVVVERAVAPLLPAVHGDRDQVKQVVLNLVQNAVEAMSVGGRLTLRGAVSSRGGERGIALSVADTGCGIKAEDLPHVFEPFFTSGKIKGTGLGLAICRNIVDAHGGDLQVTSELGTGTTFHLWLPLTPPELGRLGQPPESTAAQTSHAQA
ncbi:MAG: ATP-binding protein [Nitrospiraceae bacterium]